MNTCQRHQRPKNIKFVFWQLCEGFASRSSLHFGVFQRCTQKGVSRQGNKTQTQAGISLTCIPGEGKCVKKSPVTHTGLCFPKGKIELWEHLEFLSLHIDFVIHGESCFVFCALFARTLAMMIFESVNYRSQDLSATG